MKKNKKNPNHRVIVNLILFTFLVQGCFEGSKFQVADDAFNQGKYEEATTLFQNFIRDYPDSEKANIARNRLEALQDLERVDEFYVKSKDAEEAGDSKQALKFMEKALMLGIKRSHFQTEIFREALGKLKKTFSDERENQADEMALNQRYGEAFDLYKEALDSSMSPRTEVLREKLEKVQAVIQAQKEEKLRAALDAEAAALLENRPKEDNKPREKVKYSPIEENLIEYLFSDKKVKRDSGQVEVIKGKNSAPANPAPAANNEQLMETLKETIGDKASKKLENAKNK